VSHRINEELSMPKPKKKIRVIDRVRDKKWASPVQAKLGGLYYGRGRTYKSPDLAALDAVAQKRLGYGVVIVRERPVVRVAVRYKGKRVKLTKDPAGYITDRVKVLAREVGEQFYAPPGSATPIPEKRRKEVHFTVYTRQRATPRKVPRRSSRPKNPFKDSKSFKRALKWYEDSLRR
jgi:hypothetical protein